jgi:hypothetical protein
MKNYLQILSLMAIFGCAILVFSQCKKDKDEKPEPTTPTTPVDTGKNLSKFYDKWWYPDSTYGDFYFKSTDGTFQYKFFASLINGTYFWYPNKDSMRLQDENGGEWTAWFREINEHTFKMSRGNEDHLNIYKYKDTQ